MVGSAGREYHKARNECRKMIQDGLGESVYDNFGAYTNIMS